MHHHTHRRFVLRRRRNSVQNNIYGAAVVARNKYRDTIAPFHAISAIWQ
jgi:hypothetical protein